MSQVSVVQLAKRLPVRHCFQITNSDSGNDGLFHDKKDGPIEVNVENGAIVCVGGDEFPSEISSSPDHDSVGLPKELEGLHDKYSATCRLFKYQELLSATQNFKPDNNLHLVYDFLSRGSLEDNLHGTLSPVARVSLEDNLHGTLSPLARTDDVLPSLEEQGVRQLYPKDPNIGMCSADPFISC
ncbi:hypothetical protein QVD17_38174 [Tagetes erecta]|uniref:Uncharacterized protein n=1 Tax=Tagetes erecta TaxID=13708 RepID=A0AAD8NKP0_TARER|nr:hypothetical protein QVD17_38174 [Tagetes erecta]